MSRDVVAVGIESLVYGSSAVRGITGKLRAACEVPGEARKLGGCIDFARSSEESFSCRRAARWRRWSLSRPVIVAYFSRGIQLVLRTCVRCGHRGSEVGLRKVRSRRSEGGVGAISRSMTAARNAGAAV